MEQIKGTLSRAREEATIEPIKQSNENGVSDPNALHHVCLFLINQGQPGGSASAGQRSG